MSFDAKVPAKLKQVQQWFASIITQPIDRNSRINPITPTGNKIEEEASQYIVASPALKPFERVQIYNQQYWWRLLSTLQESFPILVRLFGYCGFNETIATPYLVKCQPNHWSLNFLGDRLPAWIEEEYHANDRQLVLDAAAVDWAYERSFYAADSPAIGEDDRDPSTLLSRKLWLQPHMHLFSLKYDLFTFRADFILKKPEYWEENDFPEMPKEKQYHFVLYRNQKNHLVWTEIEETEFLLLKKFKNGNTIEKAIEWLEAQSDDHQRKAEKNLHQWIQQWVVRRWLATCNGL